MRFFLKQKICMIVYLYDLKGYGLAWYSHFFIEQNKPATWQYPGYSFISDQRLFIESLMGKHKLYN